MREVGWAIPPNGLSASTAVRSIVWQHDQIRAVLAKARSTAAEALADAEPSPAAVASAVGDIRSIVECHLDFEEIALAPILAAERADDLSREHAWQRAMLVRLHDEARAHPQLPLLAAKLAFLADRLAADMIEEEHWLHGALAGAVS